MINSCIRCPHKLCEKAASGTLDVCDFGVAFYNDNGNILKREEKVTLRHISQNLRHELNKILQIIISNASQIDPTVSIKKIDVENPASRIVGATVIIDQFIEMISGVNDFHPPREYSRNFTKEISLELLLNKYSKLHSLVQNTRRAKDLNIDISCPSRINISFGGNIVEYIISMFFDNMWKYSLSTTSPKVYVNKIDDNLISIEFINESLPINKCDCLFAKGYQENGASEGFGYGLFWAELLVSHYNELIGSDSDTELLELHHEQIPINEEKSEQRFSLKNIRI